MPVLFPFGHGLSYTTFAYSNLRLSATTFQDVDGLTVMVDVTNTGAVAGQEIVQLYVHDRESSLVRPPKELKGFAKVALQPGETETVTIQLGPARLRLLSPGPWSLDHRGWRLRYSDRRLGRRYSLYQDGDAALNAGAALSAASRIHDARLVGGSALAAKWLNRCSKQCSARLPPPLAPAQKRVQRKSAPSAWT